MIIRQFWLKVFKVSCWLRGIDPEAHLLALQVKRDGYSREREIRALFRGDVHNG